MWFRSDRIIFRVNTRYVSRYFKDLDFAVCVSVAQETESTLRTSILKQLPNHRHFLRGEGMMLNSNARIFNLLFAMPMNQRYYLSFLHLGFWFMYNWQQSLCVFWLFNIHRCIRRYWRSNARPLKWFTDGFGNGIAILWGEAQKRLSKVAFPLLERMRRCGAAASVCTSRSIHPQSLGWKIDVHII